MPKKYWGRDYMSSSRRRDEREKLLRDKVLVGVSDA
jgi:hypothetical protein